MPLLATTRGDAARVEAPEPRRRVLDPVLASDLRRRRAPGLVGEVVRRAALLPEEDRSLLLSVYRDATPAVTIAALRGVERRHVRRRVRMLVQRVLSPRFGFVMEHLDEWAPLRRAVALALVIEGRPQREAAARLGITIHAVRRHDEAIRMLEQASRPGDAPVEEGGVR